MSAQKALQGSDTELMGGTTENGVSQHLFVLQVDLKVQHLFPIQNQKRNRETLIETSRNQSVSRNQTAILAGTLKSNFIYHYAFFEITKFSKILSKFAFFRNISKNLSTLESIFEKYVRESFRRLSKALQFTDNLQRVHLQGPSSSGHTKYVDFAHFY